MKKIILVAVSFTFFLAAFAQGDAALSNKTLTGLWKAKAGNEQYLLNQNGTSQCTYEGRECPGTWKVEGKIIIINPKKLMWRKADPCSKTRKLEVVNINGGNLTIQDISDKRTIQLTKQDIN